jgi:glutathione synthase/RimK-type ligase-like ATP-grasp enzyme
MHIGLASCRDAWRDDDDAGPTTAALEAAGARPSWPVWDDPAVDWAGFDLVVVRSTWDYVPRLAAFLQWAERVAAVTRFANPPEVLRWNTDKRYLADLAAAGVSVVPTTFLDPTDLVGRDPREVVRAALPDTGDFVVKPTVSAGSKDTTRHAGGPESCAPASRQAADLLAAGRGVMVQPYLADVDTAGETGLVYLDGRFSHAFRKGPLLQVGGGPVQGLYAREEIGPRTPSVSEHDLAERVVGAVTDRFGAAPLYARVDLLPGPDHTTVLLELELTEPSFFLDTDPGAADRVARAFVAAATL